MRRVFVLSLLMVFIASAAWSASDGELARQHMLDHPLPLPVPAAATLPTASPAAPPATSPTPAANQTDVGGDVARVKTLAGTASIARREATIPAKLDEKLYPGDTLKTGADGAIGITFRDNTTLSLGPNSAIVIQEFLFAPAQGKLSIVTRLIKGTASYLSGIIAKLSPQSVRFETPVATVGFRGTKFLVRIEEDKTN